MENLHEIIEVVLEATGKCEECASQTLSHIDNPKNSKLKYLQSRYQLTCLNYFKERSEQSLSTELCLLNYFDMLHDASRCSPGSFWCTCSMLRDHVLCTHDAIIKYFSRLKALIKKFTIDHIKKKPDIFSYEETHRGLTILFLDTNSEYLQHKIGNCDVI